jgi:hypothetical protein
MGSTVYAVDRNTGSLGTFDPKTGIRTQIGGNNTLPCCSPGLATNGTTIYYVGGGTISSVNPANGTRGTAVALTPAKPTDEMKFLGTTLYGLANSGELYSINPTTGATATLTTLGTGSQAVTCFDVFTPGVVQ